MDGDRQVAQVKRMLADYPLTTRLTDEFRRDRGTSLPNWPDWCFLPMGGAAAIVSGTGQLQLDRVPDIARIAALNTWNYSRGIYRFHPRLLEALLRSPIEDELPVEVFYRLPEWCVYIEMPPQSPGLIGDIMHGYYAHLEHDANTGRPELRLLTDENDGLHGMPLHIGDWSVLEATMRTAEETARQAIASGVAVVDQIGPATIQVADRLASVITPLLYLCSTDVKMVDPRDRKRTPRRPRPTKTRQGWKLFPPAQVTVWRVGDRLGEQLPENAAGAWEGAPDPESGRYRYQWILR